MSRNPFGQPIVKDTHGKGVYALTQGQYELVQAIDKYDILFVNGPAGTGKTYLGTCKAVAAMDSGLVEGIVLTRPVIGADEDLGFLPGTFEDKIAPYMRPLYDSLEKLKPKAPKIEEPTLGHHEPMKKGAPRRKGHVPIAENGQRVSDPTKLIEWWKQIEIAPLAYMRGATFENRFVIIDEAQNVTKSQMKMFLTRLGRGSKVIICGDDTQSDLKFNVESGFMHAQKLLEGVDGIGIIELSEKDIVRHKLVKDIIMRYEGSHRRRGVISNNDRDID